MAGKTWLDLPEIKDPFDQIETKWGAYTQAAFRSGRSKILRLMTADELQAEWCVTNMLARDHELGMDAYAMAVKHYEGKGDDPEKAARCGELHARSAASLGRMEREVFACQAELKWRLDHPEYDPNDPYANE